MKQNTLAKEGRYTPTEDLSVSWYSSEFMPSAHTAFQSIVNLLQRVHLLELRRLQRDECLIPNLFNLCPRESAALGQARRKSFHHPAFGPLITFMSHFNSTLGRLWLGSPCIEECFARIFQAPAGRICACASYLLRSCCAFIPKWGGGGLLEAKLEAFIDLRLGN